jgi:hypothetical protein
VYNGSAQILDIGGSSISMPAAFQHGQSAAWREIMAESVNEATIRALAEANGISIPENRLEIVLKQYKTYLELINQIDSFMLAREAEPAVKFELPTGGTAGSERPR